ncbi:MAG: glycosyltransferase family 9 protein [Smithellaceae bacterium]
MKSILKVRRMTIDSVRAVRDTWTMLRGIHYRLLRRRRKGSLFNVRRIMVINQQALGDATLSLPALRDLADWKASGAGREVFFVVRPEYEQWIQTRVPDVRVLSVHPQRTHSTDTALLFKSREPDMLIDMDTTRNTSNLKLAKKLKVSVIIGNDCGGKGSWPDVTVAFGSLKAPLPHISERYRNMVKAITLHAGAPHAPGTHGCKPCVYPLKIGIHPGSSLNGVSRRWPVQRFAELINKISGQWECQIHLFGGYAEKSEIDKLLDIMGGKIHGTCINQSLVVFAAGLAEMDLLLCNNSGPMHVAAELNVSTISINGPTARNFYPVKKGNDHLALHADLPCIGCNDTNSCEIRIACLKNYTSEDAWTKIKPFMERFTINRR